MPSLKAALAAFAAFIVLLSVAVVAFRGRSQSELMPTVAPALLALDPSEVLTLEVTGTAGVLRLTRVGDQWQVEAPVRALADSQQITPLVETLASLPVSRSLPLEADPAEFGLEPPEFTVILGTGDRVLATVRVGALNPDETKRYVQVAPDPRMHLVYSYQLDRLAAMVTTPPLQPTPSATATLQP